MSKPLLKHHHSGNLNVSCSVMQSCTQPPQSSAAPHSPPRNYRTWRKSCTTLDPLNCCNACGIDKVRYMRLYKASSRLSLGVSCPASLR